MNGDGVYPKRPPRLGLFANTEPFYFVTFNTYRRMPVLANEQVFQAFCMFCRRGKEERGVRAEGLVGSGAWNGRGLPFLQQKKQLFLS